MFDLSVLATYTLASFVIVIVPGVSVSLIIANSLRSGAAAGLANVAGTQLGLLTMIAALAIGLDAVVALGAGCRGGHVGLSVPGARKAPREAHARPAGRAAPRPHGGSAGARRLRAEGYPGQAEGA